jgi:hypothetical protein
LDGEIVVIDGNGKPRFPLLQSYQKTGQGALVYVVFDLLYLDGHDLRNLPLLRRKELLAGLLDKLPNVKQSEHVQEHGTALYQAVSEAGLEGIVAKDARSPYREGARSQSWLKIKTHLRHDAVIGGGTGPTDEARRLNDQLYKLWRAGCSREAVPLARRAVELRGQLLGRQDPYYALSLFNLAAQYEGLGQFAPAMVMAFSNRDRVGWLARGSSSGEPLAMSLKTGS